MEKVVINSEYITLVQLLKLVGIVQSGGEGKLFLSEEKIQVNEIDENRRGKKLYSGDIIEITGYGMYKIVGAEE
jgi:S4 domain protein YaaA